MTGTLQRWIAFLDIDEDSITTLQEFSQLITPHLDNILDQFYARILKDETAAEALTRTPETLARARAAQRNHWSTHVLAGNFDEQYMSAARMIGQTHHRIGIDMMLYTAAYSLVMDQLLKIIDALPPEALRPNDGTGSGRGRLFSAVNKALFLDLGLASSVYHDSYVGALEELSNELNLSLARAGEFRDNETGKHILRMSRMCQALALEIGQDKRWASMLRIASPLHDVGKIGIPDTVLLKPGRLDGDEMEIMRQHPRIGGEIIPIHSSDVIRMARRITLTHHERWDGSGYPAGLKGEEIPLEGRIAAICDVYDALVSHRPYKVAWTRGQALDYIRENSGHHFDPALVRSFISIQAQIDAIQERHADPVEEENDASEAKASAQSA